MNMSIIRRPRRSLALLAVLTVAPLAVLIGAAGPAAAAGEQPTIDRIKTNALIAVARPSCAKYLAGPDFVPFDNRDPLKVLTSARVVAGPVPADQPADAFASTKVFGGVNQQITVHPRFFQAEPDPPISPGAAFIPEGDHARTLLLLHEVGHLTGVEGDHNKDLPRQFDYNRDIVNNCLAVGTPGPRIDTLFCGAFPSLGWYRFRCDTRWYDGTDPVVLAWSHSYHIDAAQPGAGQRSAFAFGICSTYDRTVVLTVTDAQGWQDRVTASTGCP